MDQQEQTEPVRKKPGPKPKVKTEADALLSPLQVAQIDAQPLNLGDDIARVRALRDASPFGAFDQKLAFPPIEGYKQHWFNDKPGRVDIALRAGWTHVNDNDGKPRVIVVDSGGQKAYLLKIPEQFWAEDQARQEAKAQAALSAVKKKPDQAGMVKPQDQGAFYNPEGRPDAATITRS